MPLEYEMRLRIRVGDEPGAEPTVVETVLLPLEPEAGEDTAPNHAVASAWQELIEEYEDEQQRLEREIEELGRELEHMRGVLRELQAGGAEQAPATACSPAPLSPARDAVPSSRAQLVVLDTPPPIPADDELTDPMFELAVAPLQIGRVTEPVSQSRDPQLELVQPPTAPPVAAAPAVRPPPVRPLPVRAQSRRAIGTSMAMIDIDDLDDSDPTDPLLPEPWYKRTLRLAFGGAFSF